MCHSLLGGGKILPKPPVFRTTGTEPYLIAVSWVRPHGSKIEGTSIRSAPAYICNHWLDVLIIKLQERRSLLNWVLASTYQVRKRLIISQTKASTVPMSRMQFICQIHKIVLNAWIRSWTKQHNLSQHT